jgi:hypothetical protein
MKKISEFCNIPEISKSLVKKYKIMNKRKIRFFRYAGITLIIILTGCILFFCISTLRNNVSASNDMALEMKAVPVPEVKNTGTYGSGQKPSLNQLWSRSEVFMY